MSATLELTQQLIRRASVTPDDAGCQALLGERLRALGFSVEPLRFGEVDNLWARRGANAPLLVLAGHTDVVPSGPLPAWRTPPFTPTVEDGVLYGRGVADMKGGIAAMLTACERFLSAHPDPAGSLGFLLTSDEEGPALHGTREVMEHLYARGVVMDWCLIGEPSSERRVGDQLKNGRRGSLTGHLTVHGVQGHIAYPHLADNPVHRFAPALQELCATEWDQGNRFFPPTSFQVANLHGGTGKTNIIPGSLEVMFNFRYCTETTELDLQRRVARVLDRHGLNYNLEWEHSGPPFLTPGGDLLGAAQAAVQEVCGYPSQPSTSGGTSDGRFVAPYGVQVLELGLLNATIHKANECASVADLDTLSAIYQRLLEKLLL